MQLYNYLKISYSISEEEKEEKVTVLFEIENNKEIIRKLDLLTIIKTQSQLCYMLRQKYNKKNLVLTTGDEEIWYKDLKVHRDDGPAIKTVNDYNEVTYEWYRLGWRHRKGGPAFETIGANSERILEFWYRDDYRHREDGPAYINFIVNEKLYYICNNMLTKEEWWQEISDENKIKSLFNGY
jgi:hypothetical protein